MEAARQQRFTITDTNHTLEAVTEYVYLGRTVTAMDDDGPALRKNLLKTRKRWGFLRRILQCKRASHRISGYFYKAACQSALLYGSETWTWTSRMLSALEGFHHQVARCITKRFIRKRHNDNGEEFWIYPRHQVSLDMAGIRPMRHYLLTRREALLPYAMTDSIFYPTAATLRHPTKYFWWLQHNYLTQRHYT
jgi:hypothetical protein